MKILDIKDQFKIKYIVEVLLKNQNIKASDIEVDDQNKYSYIHFDIDVFNKDEIIVLYTDNSFVNDEIDDLNNNKIIEIFGINPDAIIKGPIEYKEIEDIYKYFKGPTNDIIDDNDKVFFCFGENLQSYLIDLYNIN